MRELLTPNRIANQIRQRRSNFLGGFLIVEGSTDANVYKNFIDDQKCEISIAHNKDNAKKALEILEKDNFAGVLAIIDADFSRLDGDLPDNPNLLLTDDHDLEIMLIHSPALDKVMGEYGSEEKIKKFGKGILATLLAILRTKLGGNNTVGTKVWIIGMVFNQVWV